MKNSLRAILCSFSIICIVTFSPYISLAQKDTPCECAQRWNRGGHWNNDGTVNDASTAPNPLGVVRCGSSAETMSTVKANGCSYNSSQFQIIPQGCRNPATGQSVNVNSPTEGCPVIWLNFDQRPAAGSYQFQIVSNDAYSWALYYSVEHQSGIDANGLSGDCSKLAFYACGNSFTGWATFATPSFLPATNLYIAIWRTTGCGTQSGFSVSFKGRYGCGDADFVMCNAEAGASTVTCNSDGTYSVNVPINGVNGNYQGYDPNATPTTSNIVTLTNIGNGGPVSGIITMTYPQSVSSYNITIDDVILSSGDIIPSNPDSCSFNVTGNGLNCDDGDPRSDDLCDNGVCVHVCDDENECTQDSYLNGACIFTGGDCNDGDACTQDVCDPDTGCSNPLLNCDDGDPASADVCEDGICTHICNDGNACTQDSYINGNCVFSGGDCNDNSACTQDVCNPATGCSNNENCDDGNPQSVDACVNGNCTHTCNDNNACTQDSYVNANCVFTGGNCNDNNACTQDICDPATGCSNIENCDDGNPNTIDACVNGVCTYTNTQCNDGNPCTNDAFVNGTCIFTPINCDDGNPQSVDNCVNGVCTHTCDDGIPCTSDSYVNGNCIFSPNCNDNDVCTVDNCVNNACQHTPFCVDDNNPCTVNYCRNSNQTPVCIVSQIDCSDNVACTIDGCNPANGECTHDASGCNNDLICPPKLIIVLDESGSIAGYGQGSVGVTTQVRNGVAGMFTALSETDIDVAVVEFNTRARRAVINGTTAYQQITPGNLSSFLAYVNDNNTTADNNHFDPEDYLSNTANAFTNWDDALKMVQSINANDGLAPLVLFFTDGKPTAYNNANGTVTTGTGSATVAEALSKAVASANSVKAQGAHLFVVAFPNPSLTEYTVQAISGPMRYPDIQPDFTKADYSIESSTSLENSLKAIAGLLCRADLRLTKSVSPTNACPGSQIIFKLKVTNDGLDKADIVQVKDYLPSGYSYVSNNRGASFVGGVLTWNVGTILNTKSDSILITATVNQSGNYTNVAEVFYSNKSDSDSDPANFSGSPDEDDESSASISLQGCNGGGCTSSTQCNDANACTQDACASGVCVNSPINCNDNNSCTVDGCNSSSGCSYSPIQNCGGGDPCAGINCDDGNSCTADACVNGSCTYTAIQSQPSYLKITNPMKSWRKLKLGYSSTNLYSPMQNVAASGNNQMCITLRAVGIPEWNKIQVRPQGSSTAAVVLGNYISGVVGNFTTFCIPLSAFTGYNFSSISYLEIPYSNGANPFEIHIAKIEFTGGATPFLWFGDPKTNNIHDGQSGGTSALTASLVPGTPCNSSKMESGETTIQSPETFIIAYPNPFKDQLNFQFSVASDSEVTLEMFNVTGSKLATVFEGTAETGRVVSKTFSPADLSTGIYIYRLKTNETVLTEKVLLAR